MPRPFQDRNILIRRAAVIVNSIQATNFLRYAMIRRLLLFGALVYVGIRMVEASEKSASAKREDELAESNWDSEGGSPAKASASSGI